VDKGVNSRAVAPKRFNQYHRGVSGGAAASGIAASEPKFNVWCEEIKGFICDCTDGRQANRYNLSMKEIAENIG
jgi:hypothetical protein